MRTLMVPLAALFILFPFASGADEERGNLFLPSADVSSAPAVEPNAQFDSLSIGHLVTANNKLLPKHKIAVGTLYAAVGATEHWSIGVSPFAFLTFGMYNVLSRWAWDVAKRDRFGLDFAYYKTSEREEHKQEREPGAYSFKMEAWSAKTTWSHIFSRAYRLSVTGGYFHYIDDERPFSLRMDPANDDNYSLHLTSPHELKLNRYAYLNLEAGFWGLNYTYPYYHAGTSLNLQNATRSFLLGFGVSSTFSPSFPAEKARYFAAYDSRASVHPELQIEVFF